MFNKMNFLFFQPSQEKWRKVFVLCAIIYVFCATFYIIFGSGERQAWDDPQKDQEIREKKEKKQKQLKNAKINNETRH